MLSKVLVLVALISFAIGGTIPAASETADADIIPGQYIVVMKDDLSTSDFEAHKDFVASKFSYASNVSEDSNSDSIIIHTYDLGNITGYAARLDGAAIQEVAARPEVCTSRSFNL